MTDDEVFSAEQIPGVLRLAADDFDRLPAWRRWLAVKVSGREWGYALRSWAALESREAFEAHMRKEAAR